MLPSMLHRTLQCMLLRHTHASLHATTHAAAHAAARAPNNTHAKAQ
jgi:hypothetical protein